MNRILLGLALTASAVPALAADVGVTIGINQPGVYGRIDIGRVPVPPVLVYERPMIIVQEPVAVHRQPIYLYVPPGHARDWRRYCGRYQACGQPVYFVQDRWYNETYVPRVYAKPAKAAKPDKRHHDDKRGRGHDDDDRGNGKGHGKGHDKHGKD